MQIQDIAPKNKNAFISIKIVVRGIHLLIHVRPISMKANQGNANNSKASSQLPVMTILDLDFDSTFQLNRIYSTG